MSSYALRADYAAEKQFGRLLEKYGVVFNGTTDDSSALQEAINASIVANRIRPIVFPAEATACKLNSGVIFALSSQRINCNGMRFDASGMSSGAVFTLQGTGVTDEMFRQGIAGIDNAMLVGPGRASAVTAFDWTGSGTGRSTRSGSYNLFASDFGIGHRFGSYGYLNHFYNLNANRCGIGMHLQSGTDAGENISLHGGAIYNSDLALKLDATNSELNCHSVAYDYNGLMADLNAGRLMLTDCHIESDSVSDDQIDLDGNGTHFSMKGGLLQWYGTYPSSWAQYGNVKAASCTASFSDVLMHNMGNSAERLFTGPGLVLAKSTQMLNTPNMPARLHDQQKSSMVFGGFESAATTAPLLAYCAGSATFAARATGTNITMTTSAAQANSGSTSLAIARTGGVTPQIFIFVPVRGGDMFSFRFADYNPSAIAGTYTYQMRWLAGIPNGAPLYADCHNETIATSAALTMPTGAWGYRNERAQPARRAPAWANYLRITLDYSSMSNGTWYIDDFSVHLW